MAFGFQEHACRHMVLPAQHGLSENPERNTHCSRMGGDRQSVGTGTDDGNIKDRALERDMLLELPLAGELTGSI